MEMTLVRLTATGLILISLALVQNAEAKGPRIKNSAGIVEGNQLDGKI